MNEDDARAAIAAAGAELGRAGLTPGASGNISVRLGDTVLMTATGTSLASLGAASFSVLDAEGGLVEGPAPSKEFPLHRAFYRKDPAAGAVVHLHSPFAMAASCLPPWSERSAIPPLSPYFVMRVGQAPLIGYLPPGDPRLEDAVLALGFPFRAVLLQNHGQTVASPTLAAAVQAAIELEEACRLAVLLEGRNPHILDHESARSLAERWGTAWE